MVKAVIKAVFSALSGVYGVLLLFLSFCFFADPFGKKNGLILLIDSLRTDNFLLISLMCLIGGLCALVSAVTAFMDSVIIRSISLTLNIVLLGSMTVFFIVDRFSKAMIMFPLLGLCQLIFASLLLGFKLYKKFRLEEKLPLQFEEY